VSQRLAFTKFILMMFSGRIGDVTLKHLDLLKLETGVLAKAVALGGPISQWSQLDILNSRLCDMLMEVRGFTRRPSSYDPYKTNY
jgi:hypothetical protein